MQRVEKITLSGVFALFLFLHIRCAAQELVYFSSYSPQTDSSLERMISHQNPYWEIYAPLPRKNNESFVIFPNTAYNSSSQVWAISFFLKPSFMMAIFPKYFTSPLNLISLGRNYLLPIFLDKNFLLKLLNAKRYLFKTLNEVSLRSSDKIDLINPNDQNFIPPYILKPKVLQDFKNHFPLFPLDIFDEVPSFKYYQPFQGYMDLILEVLPISIVVTNALNYFNNAERRNKNPQEILSYFMQDLYVSIKTENNENFVISLVKKQKYSEVFLRLNEHIRDESLWTFPFIKKYAAEICWFFKDTKPKEQIFPLLCENLIKALSTDYNNNTSARTLFSNIFPNIKIPESDRINLVDFTTIILSDNMFKQEGNTKLQEENTSLRSNYDKLQENYLILENHFIQLQGKDIRIMEENTNLKESLKKSQEAFKLLQEEWGVSYYEDLGEDNPAKRKRS